MTANYEWVGAYKRRKPHRREVMDTVPHIEMFEVRRREQWVAEGMRLLAKEFDRDLQEQDEAE